jgi:serine/threonine protein kinase
MIVKVLKRQKISIHFIANVSQISLKIFPHLFYILVYSSTRDIRDKRVNFDDFETIKIIGRGAFGTVDLVRRKATGQVYAMKTLSKFEMVKIKYFPRK